MIKVTNDGECEIDGDVNMVINQTAMIMIRVAKTIEESYIMSKEDALSRMNDAVTINGLIESGMSSEEALNVVAPDGNISLTGESYNGN